MNRIGMVLALAVLPACAALGMGGSPADAPAETWAQAHQALAVQDFDRAAAMFQRLVEEHPESQEGREALFYLGAMRLDPRNPAWDPEPAETRLREYLAPDTIAGRRLAHRRPEAETLLHLAHQLNMPAGQRVPGLQPEPQVVVEEAPPRVVVRARESRALAAEVARLRQQLEERDATIQRQRDEIDRIRRTLTRGGSGGG